MEFREFTEGDIGLVVPLYISYFNEFESGGWTDETAQKRLHQMFSREDAFGLLAIEDGEPKGFALGHFEQFDDGKVFNLVEIVIEAKSQNKGFGSALMKELEAKVRVAGAFSMSIQSVNDDRHERFYSRLGFNNSKSFVLKVKFFGRNNS